ncbi:hypothetical protein TNCV_5038361 [Trichonephila clavipes]|nr:hypothetical protein TNCV_5038361 [Trichonephila clavipes]
MLPVLGKKAVLEWRMKEGLIGSSYVCPKCRKSIELRERTETHKDPVGMALLIQEANMDDTHRTRCSRLHDYRETSEEREVFRDIGFYT